MRVFNSDGSPLDSRFSIERYRGTQSLVLEAAWGRPARDYPHALRLLLGRLQDLGAVIADAFVDSRVSRALPSDADRRLVLRNGRSYPIRLRAVSDLEELRLAIGAAQEHVAQKPGAKGGNRNKRIRLVLAAGEEPLPSDLQGILSGGRQGSPEIEDALDASAIAAGKRPTRSGFRQSAPARRAIELRAMKLAADFLKEHGCTDICDVSSSESYDLRCRFDAEELHVEVKGTTSEGERVLLTRNEVAHAREWHPSVALVVVAGIDLAERGGVQVAVGGHARIIHPWEVLDTALEPISYECVVPPLEPDAA
jgi:hypothetical protein